MPGLKLCYTDSYYVLVSIIYGSQGIYNQYFKTLGENLVKYSLSTALLRIGWEFNGDWYKWTAVPGCQYWALYFAHIVMTMRAVPGKSDLAIRSTQITTIFSDIANQAIISRLYGTLTPDTALHSHLTAGLAMNTLTMSVLTATTLTGARTTGKALRLSDLGLKHVHTSEVIAWSIIEQYGRP